MAHRLMLKRGDAIEVHALDEWMPATFVRTDRHGAIHVVLTDGAKATTTIHSIRKTGGKHHV